MKFDDWLQFIEKDNKLLGEARNNDVAEHNVYSTDRILNIAQQRNDKVTERGDIIFIEPDSQPCEYATFTKRNFCVADPEKPDWSNFVQYMRPRGAKFIFAFRKSEPVNKKKIPDNFVHVFVVYNQPIENVVGTSDPDEIAQIMYSKAKEELGLSDDEMIYSLSDLRDYVTDMQSHRDGNLWEIYDAQNKLTKLSTAISFLSNNGVSQADFMSII